MGAGSVREVRDWLVAADDRTGAFEVAALFAHAVGPVTVTVGEAPAGSGVVDLGSRAMSASDAQRAATTLATSPAAWVAHKIDSTLRGNWAAELLARQQATGRRIVLLPGWPELGRTCVGGEVFVDDTSVGSVLDQLPSADVVADAGSLGAWLGTDNAIAVCDVPTTAAMHALAAVLAGYDVLVAGPAGPLGAVFAASRTERSTGGRVQLDEPVLVVCGSAHHVSREQLRRLRLARPDLAAIATPAPDDDLHHRAVLELVAQARVRMAELQPRTLVIIGGDTAAELLGPAPRTVSGFAALGMPVSVDETGDGPVVVTKAGGFGGPNAIVDLLGGENG